MHLRVSMRARLIFFLVCTALPVVAQSHLERSAGAVISLDLAGGAFPALTPAGVDLSGGLGYRFGNGLDVEALVGYGGVVADTLFPYPAELHLGATLGIAFGEERSPWRVSASGLVSVSGGDTFTFPRDGPTEVSGGRSVVETNVRAQAMRYVDLTRGRVRVSAGVGVFGAVRWLSTSTLIFRPGEPTEVVSESEDRREIRRGGVLAVPVALDLGRGAVLVLDAQLRLGVDALIFGVGDGQLTLRLQL